MPLTYFMGVGSEVLEGKEGGMEQVPLLAFEQLLFSTGCNKPCGEKHPKDGQ